MKQLVTKNQYYIATNFTYLQKIVILKYNWNCLEELLLLYKFHGREM